VWLPNLSKMGEHNRSIALFNPTLNVLAYVPALATLGSELPRTPSPRSSHSGHSAKFAFWGFSEVGQEFIGDSSPVASVVALINLRRGFSHPAL
jgi:hypothetical protein